MGNNSEGDVWVVDIQLMYAQQWPVGGGELTQHERSIQVQQQLLQQQILMSQGGGGGGGGGGVGTSATAGRNQDASESLKRAEKSLRELLEEQDIGESICPLLFLC